MKKNQTATGKNPKKASSSPRVTDPKKASSRTCPTDPGKASSRTRPTDPGKSGAQLQRERDFTVRWVDPWALETPHLNDLVYGHVDDDAHMDELTESMKRYGTLTPLCVNREGYIMSGNRRRTAACRAGLHEVPAFVWDVKVHTDEFSHLLVEANETRIKGADSQIAEIGVRGAKRNPEIWLGIQRVNAEMRERCGGMAAVLDVPPRKRKEIVETRAFADAVIEAVNEELEQGVVPTLRQVHYLLLNNPPMRNTRTGNRYKNNEESYKALSEIAGRLRVFGELPFDSIVDSGRKLFMPPTYAHAGEYTEKWLRWFGGDYRRNVMRSQGAFFAVAVEKEALGEVFRRHVEEKYPGACVMVCKGKVSHSLVHELRTAFKQSAKSRMLLLAFVDCDTDGMEIVHDLPKKLLEQGLREDEFTVVHCGLTHDQAQTFNARPQPLKKGSKSQKTKARKFVECTGHDTGFELEALPPVELLRILDDEMAARMDVNAYNAEVEAMPGDAKALMDAQQRLYAALKPGGVKGADR